MMFTVLVTPDNKNIMLPNSLIVGGKVTNFSACQTRRISIPVTIPYSADLAKVRQTLAHYIENEPRVLKDPPPCIGPDSFTDRGIQISVMAWVERSAYWDVFLSLIHILTIKMFKTAFTMLKTSVLSGFYDPKNVK